MKRIGLSFPGFMPLNNMFPYFKRAEELGYESFWLAEDHYFRDSISLASATAVMTKEAKIGLGVINFYTRSPALIAMTIATLDEISNQRAILGIGTSLRHCIEQQGMKFYKNSLTAVKEAVEIIRRLIAGEHVNYQGEVFNIQDVNLTFKPTRNKIPVYIAAMGPRMCQLAGEIGDGLFFSIGTPLSYMKIIIENMKIGAERAGRNINEIDLIGYFTYSVSKDPQKAREAVKPMVAIEFQPVYDPLLASTGIEVKNLASIRASLAVHDYNTAVSNVTDEMIDLFAIAGTEAECKAKLDRFRAAGVNLPIIWPMGDINAAIETNASKT